MHIALTLILIIQILSALTMVGLILMQHGKGADMGASFGSGSSGSLFGATGSANFLSRSTAVAATLFFVCTLALAYFGNRADEGGGLMGKLAGSEQAVSTVAASAASKQAASAVPAGIAQIPGAGPTVNVASSPKTAVIPANKSSGSK
jgi:preprotein translocase subunit SecG